MSSPDYTRNRKLEVKDELSLYSPSPSRLSLLTISYNLWRFYFPKLLYTLNAFHPSIFPLNSPVKTVYTTVCDIYIYILPKHPSPR